uniref:DNA methylase adenine-specific domain-containing protein n=1 Tax=Leptospirillum ferrodiazotrophum TaxID=412449 RepID=C6I098_9BACT|nr:MAG: hypothetical protein UBAL3_95660008 [Leptospirillum ferrodiazotrophum]
MDLGGILHGKRNFAWVQNFIYHMASNGVSGFVLANGFLSSNQNGEGGSSC